MVLLKLKYKILIKKIIILFIFSIFLLINFFNSVVYSKDNSLKIKNDLSDCNKINFDKNNLNKKIKKIEIKVKNNKIKSWVKNSLAILTSKNIIIERKHKKRFISNIKIYFHTQNDVCLLKGSIRQSGDWKDHIFYKSTLPREIYQSLDVRLINSHINGITKFKLLIPNTRNFIEEMILLKILEDLNFIVPRTFLTNLSLNEQSTIKVLFQENPVKELLEFNKQIEGPILEGDEKFLWNFPKRGDFFKAENIALSRMINSNWSLKNDSNMNLSLEAITLLNNTYLDGTNELKKNKTNYYLDNKLLSNGNKNIFKKLNTFDLLMYSTGATHALRPHNRKFYYNKIYKSFLPIYYEGMPTFALSQIELDQRYLDSKDFLIDYFKNFNYIKIKNDLKKSGLQISNKELKDRVNNLIINLKALKIKPNNKPSNEKINLNTYLDRLYSYNENYQYSYLKKTSLNELVICESSLDNCINQKFNAYNNYILKDYLENRVENREILPNQFFGKVNETNELDIETNNSNIFNKQIRDKDIFILYNNDVDININEKKINIVQLNENGKVIILDSKLNDQIISFEGINKSKIIDKEKFHKNFSTTGCLTFYNTEFKNTSIIFENSICEDAINIINSNGKINKIVSTNSYHDSVDFDFSEIELNEVVIKNAYNDCLDFSFGNYKLNKGDFSYCGDKAISVGENSNIIGKNLRIDNSNIGIAVKDSSIGFFDKISMNNLKYCYSSYKKKQEFSGGKIGIKNNLCKNYQKKIDVDSYSSINFINE